MEYHKIETLYERDENTFKVKPGVLKNPVYSLIKEWQWTEKIDGINARIMWNANQFNEEGTERGNLSVGGKTDTAQLPVDFVQYLLKLVPIAKLREVFPAAQVVLYGEGYGAGIQKGGCYSPTKKFILFDVFVCDTPDNNKMGGWWLNWENTCDVAKKLGLDVVPYIGCWTLEGATRLVQAGFLSYIQANPNGSFLAEGLVGRPAETFFDKKGARLIVKLKTKDFAKEK